MRTISLFSGCGGSDLGAKRAGLDIVFANDNSSACAETYIANRAILAAEDAEFYYGDVREIRDFPSCEVALGCYPCQSFTMGGPRKPKNDPRTDLYLEFARCLDATQPRFFVAENVPGLAWLEGARYLRDQVAAFRQAGRGYKLSVELVNAKDYGVPAERRRLIIVGVRNDQGAYYWFPTPTHGPDSSDKTPHTSHGDAIESLPIDPAGEYFSRDNPADKWWYMSRNRKRAWEEPSHAIVANWRHAPLHPASPRVRNVSRDPLNRSMQKWEFEDAYDHLDGHPDRPRLPSPRRLSWREAAILQTFPPEFAPSGVPSAKFRQIGNAVPPLLMQRIVEPIVDGSGLHSTHYEARVKGEASRTILRSVNGPAS
jgi:DNA (cytosine-5)-methyltransferase 1